MPADQPGSAYFLDHLDVAEQRATFAIIVANEPGVLHRVVGLFSARGYNIESLTVAETDRGAHTSRITIVTSGTREVLEQIRAQLEKMVATHEIRDVSRDPLGVEREMALIKVRGTGLERVEALRVADIFRAKANKTRTRQPNDCTKSYGGVCFRN
jgi:acetolactate synthase-1/3 small subunit